MHTCVFTCVRLYTNTEIRTGAACLHCNWLTQSQFTYSMCQLGRLPWPLKNDTQMIHSVLLGFKHLAAVKYLDYLNSSLFKRNKQKNSMTLSHIFQLLHSFIWCHVDLSYGVLWICFGSSMSSSAIIWSHVGARRRFSSLWSDWKSKKYCGDGHPRVSESG